MNGLKFEQQLIEQLYAKNNHITSLNKDLWEVNELLNKKSKELDDIKNRLQAQEQVNIEQKKKIEDMIEKSKKESNGNVLQEIADMIKGSNINEGCKEIVLNVFDIYKSNKKREKEISLLEELSNQVKKEREQMNNGN